MGIKESLRDIKSDKDKKILEKRLRSYGYSGFRSISTLINKVNMIFITLDHINQNSTRKVVIENTRNDEEFRKQFKNLIEALDYFNKRQFKIVNEFNPETYSNK